MKHNGCDLGVIGLGAMGRNLALNFLGHDFAVTGHDKDRERVETWMDAAPAGRARAANDLPTFIDQLRQPRTVLLLVPAGSAVDSVLDELRPHLAAGDVVIDGGNSHHQDTERRQQDLSEDRIQLLGMGISGGAYGARHGPSLMPGGTEAAYDQVRSMVEAAAARVDDEPCVAYLGPNGTGHFVKMIHNGIEYGIMQLIAETYHLLHDGLGLDEQALSQTYAEWNAGMLNSYLLEITAQVFATTDEQTGRPLIEMILDVARQTGTGMWTSQCAMELQVPVPTIDMGVVMRNLSSHENQRQSVTRTLRGPTLRSARADEALRQDLRNAYLAALVLTYAQGFALLSAASREFEYDLTLSTIARIWRGGCIIRAAVLDDIRHAFSHEPELPTLMADEKFSRMLTACQADLRRVVCAGAELGIPLPAFMASLAYLDAFRCDRLPANLIQAQRDFFGSHTYERVDAAGRHHTAWQEHSTRS